MKVTSYIRFGAFLAVLLLGLAMVPFSGPGAQEGTSSTTEPSIQAVRSGLMPNMDNNITYAIITDYHFTPYLESLKEMKTQKGVKAEIYELTGDEGIIDNYLGRGIDDAQRIHEFLVDLDMLNPDLEWVLLVGDHEIIPARNLYLNGSTSTNYKEEDCGIKQYTYSDYYYAGLDSDWNSDMDQTPIIWGEEGETDWTPNVYVGRLPVNTPTEAERAIQNIIDYELNPPPGYWYRSFLTYAGLMDTPNILNYPSNPDRAYQSYKDNAYEVALKIQKHIPEQMTNYLLYDYNRIEGGSYSPFYDTLNHSNAVNYWDLGNSLVTFASHGYENGDAFVQYQADGDMWFHSYNFPYFDYTDAYNSNNGGMLPLVYGSACGVGNFTEKDDSNMERLLYAENGGAIGVIVASSESTYRCEFQENDSSYGNWWLVDEFWRLFLDGCFQPGKALYESKVNYGDRIMDPLNPHKEYPYKTLYKTNRVAYNLLGDPEIPIWTDIPQELKVEYPKPLHINNQSITLKVTSLAGNPVENALVCVYRDDIYLTGRTDMNGSLTLPLSLDSTISLNITVTAHNFLRWTGAIEVVSILDLTYEKSTWGRSVEYPLAGDTITVYVNVTNQGSVGVNDLTIEFYEQWEEEENLIRTFDGETLGPLESKKYSLQWEVLDGITTIMVSIDPDNEFFEFNEGNNIGSIEITDNKPVTWLAESLWVNIPEDSELIDYINRSYNLKEYGLDPDQGPEALQFSITNVSEPTCNCSLVEMGQDELYLNMKPPPDWTGTVRVMISITDGPTEENMEYTVLVENVPDHPYFPSIPRQYARESETFSMQIEAIDIDSDDLTFQCGSDTLVVGCRKTGNKSVNLKLLANNSQVGDHLILLEATDEANLTTPVEIKLTVLNANTPPEIIEPMDFINYSLEVDSEFILYITAEDEDRGDILYFSDDCELFDINRTSGAIRFIPGESDVGVHNIRITVSDENGTSDFINLTFEVIPEDEPIVRSWTILVIFIICVVAVVILILVLRSRKKEGAKEVENEVDGPLPEEPVSAREWARRDPDVEELVKEYGGGERKIKKVSKRLKRPKVTRSLKKAKRPKALPLVKKR
jgi:hypothetical protein